MKQIGFILILLMPLSWAFSQNLKPYILGFNTSESISITKEKVKSNLTQNGIKVVGQYQPAKDKNRWILVFSSIELENAVKKVGGLTGFATTLRIGITRENGKTIVSYTNPVYWGNAYFRDDFPKVSSYYTTLTSHMKNAMKASGTFVGTSFGSKNGLSVEDLREYQYMFGMPYFDDTDELEDFDTYQAALSKIDASIKNGVPNLKQIYKIKIPGKNLCLYGFALLGEDGESAFLPIVDIGKPKHTAFLPYEVLVMDNEVHILNGRYRIALSFPDLTMGTFSQIMSTPGNIEDLLEQLVD